MCGEVREGLGRRLGKGWGGGRDRKVSKGCGEEVREGLGRRFGKDMGRRKG